MSATVIDEPRRAPSPTSTMTPAAATAPMPAVAPVVPVRRRSRKPIVLLVLLGLIAVAAAVGVPWYIHASHFESTDDAAIDGHVVTISPQVPAAVAKVLIDDNQKVAAGQVLVELDPTDYQVAVEQARATRVAVAGKLEQAESEIVSAGATRNAAAADVDVAQANALNAHADFGRYVALQKRTPGAVSKMQFDQSTAGENGAIAQVAQAKARLAQAASEIETRKAMLAAAKGDLAKADADIVKATTNLGYCTIRAPRAGRITRKSVEPGSYVATGQQLFALVPDDVWVTANFKETQLARMRKGQPVTVTVDAYPGLTLHGHVDSFQAGTGGRFSLLPAENATGNFVKVVQRLPVKIVLDGHPGADPDHPLSPGMSVQPEVSLVK